MAAIIEDSYSKIGQLVIENIGIWSTKMYEIAQLF